MTVPAAFRSKVVTDRSFLIFFLVTEKESIITSKTGSAVSVHTPVHFSHLKSTEVAKRCSYVLSQLLYVPQVLHSIIDLHAGSTDDERLEVFTAVTMKNAVFYDIKTQFVLHRRHITSPLQIPAS
jgi:uncharacterized membrane protein